MKRINRLLVAFALLSLCTGCTINYNIEITKDSVNESIEVTDTITNNRSKNDILSEYQSWIPAYIDLGNGNATNYDSSIKNPDFEYHEKNIKELSNGYYYTYKYNYPIYKYENASATREAYAKRKFYIGSNYIIINTDKENLLCNYSYFEKLRVSITVDNEIYKLNYTNADEQKSNVYVWNLDKNNCQDSEIILKLDILDNSSSQNNNPNNSSSSNNSIKKISNNYSLYIFLTILILIIFLGYKWFIKLKEENNNIDDD